MAAVLALRFTRMRIDRDAWPFLAILVPVTIAGGFWLWPVGAGLGLLTLAIAAFFRDPERTPSSTDDVFLAPADGRVIRSGPDGVSIFLSLFDVHVCRSPVAGVVLGVDHVPGCFLAAWNDEASTANERAALTVDTGAFPVRFTLVAGLVARRIVCRVERGTRLVAGQRVGLIRFGSRVDIELPGAFAPAVVVGERVRGGESVLARPRQALRADSAKPCEIAASVTGAGSPARAEGYS